MNGFELLIKLNGIEDFDKLKAGINSANKEITDQIKLLTQLNGLNKTANNNQSSYSKTEQKIKSYNKALKENYDAQKKNVQVSKEVVSSQNDVSNSMQKMTGISLKATAAIAAIFAGAMALGGLKNLIADMSNLAGTTEKYIAILSNLEGSSKKAYESLEKMNSLSKDLAVPANQMTEAYVKLKSYGLDPTEKSLRTVFDTAAGSGKDAIQYVEALADAVVGENERLKEFGVRASRGLEETIFTWTDVSGKTKSIVSKNNSEMINSTIDAIFNERYAGQAEKMKNTYEGVQMMMQSTIAKSKETLVTQSGIFEGLKNSMKIITETVEILMKDIDITNYSDEITNSFMYIVEKGSYLVPAFKAIGNAITLTYSALSLSFSGISRIITDSVSGIQKAYNYYKYYNNEISEFELKQLNFVIDKKNEQDVKKIIEGARNDIKSINKDFEDIKLILPDHDKLLDNISKIPDKLKKVSEESNKIKGDGIGQFMTEEDIKNQKKLEDNYIQGQIQLLKVRGSEREAAMLDLNQRLIKMQKDYGYDMTQIEEIKASEILRIDKEISDKKEKDLKKIKDDNERRLKEQNDYLKTTLENEIKYYRETKNFAKEAEAQLTKYKIDLKEKGFKEGSDRYIELVKIEEKRLIDIRQESIKKEADEEYQRTDRKLAALETYYSTVGNYIKENEIKLQRQLNGLNLNEDLTESQKAEMSVELKTKNASDELVREAQKNKKYLDIMKRDEEAFNEEIKVLREQLKAEKYTEIQIEEMINQKRLDFQKEYRKEITDQMTLQEALNAQMQNSAQDMQNRILTTAQLAASATGSVLNKMEEGLTNFFDASSDGFMNLEELSKSVVQNILTDISKLMAKQAAASIMSAAMGGGGFSFFANGGAFTSSGVQAFANGGAFAGGKVTAFANGGSFTNSIASSPTLAPMALFGEAGPEAIMPLKRDSQGRLGVSADMSSLINPVTRNGSIGSSGNTNSNVVVSTNVIINNNANVSLTERKDDKGNQIIDIDEIDARLANKARGNNSKFADVMRSKN